MGDIVLQNPLGNTRHFGIISNETVGEFRLRSFVPAEYTLIWRGDVLKNYEKMVCGTIHIVVQLTSGRHPNTSVGRIVKDVALSGTSVLLDCFAAATKSDSKLATKNLLYSDQALMEAFEKLKEEHQ